MSNILYILLQEKNHVLDSLKTRAKLDHQRLNSIDGITCNEVMGAMYAFPRIHLPQKAVQKAKVKVVYLLLIL